MKIKIQTFVFLVLVLVIRFHTATTNVLAQTVPQRLGFPTGEDWEPAITADNYGHVYTIWPRYGNNPVCPSCPSPTMMIQTSSDGGTTWTSPSVMTPNSVGTYQVDAQIVVDPLDGKTVYASWLQNNKSDVIVVKSTNFGQTWSTPVVADNINAGTDKPLLTVRGSDVYVGFSHIQKSWVSASHDGGKTFTTTLVKQGNFGLALAGGGVINSKGVVFFSWEGYTQSGQAKGPVNLFISKSTDGGQTWTISNVDTSTSPPVCNSPGCGWAFLGPDITLAVDTQDVLYALWNAGTVSGGNERIYFARSIDNGKTWSPRIDVSNTPSGVEHSFPAIAARNSGDVRIGWMDTSQAGQWNVFYKTSTDGGQTWSSNSVLSSYVPGYSYITPNGFNFPYGDYWEMTIDNLGQTHAIWGAGESYSGNGNIWYARP